MRGTEVRGELFSLLEALEEIRLLDDASTILRRAVELARDVLGMARVRILLLDHPRGLMLGTWGTDRSGAVIDEHDLVLAPGEADRAAIRRLEQDGRHFTVFEDCPLLEYGPGAVRAVGRGWVAKTPIRSARTAIAMFTNDAGTTGGAPDEVIQVHAAILCSLLGEMLTPLPRRLFPPATPGLPAPERLVASVVELLDADPALAGKQLAAALNTNLSHLCGVFRILMGMSLVDYRNRLRLQRVEALLDRGGATLMAAVREAGFGSYSQFHRVFRAHVGAGPREYLRGPGRRRAWAPRSRAAAITPDPPLP